MPRRCADPRRALVGALAVASAWAAGGHAATTSVASDPVYGGANQAAVYCTFANTGTSAIVLSGYAIIGVTGPLPLAFDTCARAPLNPGGDCQIAASTDGPAVCTTTVMSKVGSAGGLRGVADARDAASAPLWSTPVH